MNSNPYEVLGIARDASDADIKKAYHKLVMKYHPDRNPGDKSAEDKFKEVNNAFDILKDPQKRAAYDRFGSAAFAGGNGASAGAGGNPFGGGFDFNMGGGAGMEDILREAMRGFGFGNFGGGGARSAAPDRRGRDLLDEVVIDLCDAYFGKTHTVKFSSNVECENVTDMEPPTASRPPVVQNVAAVGMSVRSRAFSRWRPHAPNATAQVTRLKKECDVCDGVGAVHKSRTLEVKIPAGVEDGARLRLAGQGEAGTNGGPAGDFYLDVRVRPDKRFQRVGADLIMHMDIAFTTLALGGEIDVETINDKTLAVKVPAGTQVGERLRVRGHGMPGRRAGTFGDMYIEVGINIPTKLTEKQKKLLTEFAETKPGKKGWF